MALEIIFICPECGKRIEGNLTCYNYGNANIKNPISLCMRGCDSGGIYDVYVICPKCEEEIDIYD